MSQGRFNLAEDNKIASVLDMMRDQKVPPAVDGEKVLKHGQAAYDGGYALRSSWKMGRLYLTEKRMVFFQGQNRLFDISLDSINGANLIERNWIPGKLVKQLCIIQNGKERKRKFYLSVKREEQWKETIEKQITTTEVSPKRPKSVPREVKGRSRGKDKRQLTEIRRLNSKKRCRKA